MIEKIKERFEELSYTYEYVGVRIQEEEFKLGELNHVSHRWEDGEDTGEELDGVCAIKVGFPGWENLINSYFGHHAAIVCGYDAEYGDDVGEIIIHDPTVEVILS